jgi:hypothetical protein
MKKILLFCCGIAATITLCGCALAQSSYAYGGGFPRTMPGILLADQSSGGYIAPKMQSMKDMEVLGPVYSTVEGQNVLLFISHGDISIAKAKEIAMRKYPGADDIVNVEIDMQHKGILSIFNTVVMHYRGIAVKYKK